MANWKKIKSKGKVEDRRANIPIQRASGAAHRLSLRHTAGGGLSMFNVGHNVARGALRSHNIPAVAGPQPKQKKRTAPRRRPSNGRGVGY